MIQAFSIFFAWIAVGLFGGGIYALVMLRFNSRRGGE